MAEVKDYELTIKLSGITKNEADEVMTIRQLAEIDNMDIDWEVWNIEPIKE